MIFCDGWEDLNLQIQFLPSQILKLNAFEQKHFPFMFLEVYQLCTWDHAQMRNKTKETNISSIALSDYLPLASLMNLAVWHAAQVIQCCYIRTDRRKFRSQISDISKVEAGQCQESTRRQRERERVRERVRRKKMHAREMLGISRNWVIPMVCGSGRSKGRLAKTAGAEQSVEMSGRKVQERAVISPFENQKC